MNSHDGLDRRIDDHLQDKDTQPGPGFTARVLERISTDRAESDAPSSHRQPWWLLIPVAAAIVLALFLPSEELDDSGEIADGVEGGAVSQTQAKRPAFTKIDEIEDILVMEESLRDFEILFDDDALEILALLDE